MNPESDPVWMPRFYLGKARTLYLPTLCPSTADRKAHRYPRVEWAAQASRSLRLHLEPVRVGFGGVGAAALAEVMSSQPGPHV